MKHTPSLQTNIFISYPEFLLPLKQEHIIITYVCINTVAFINKEVKNSVYEYRCSRLITILSAIVQSYNGAEQGALYSPQSCGHCSVPCHGHMIMIQGFGNWLTIMILAASHCHWIAICNLYYISNTSLLYPSSPLAPQELLRICGWT